MAKDFSCTRIGSIAVRPGQNYLFIDFSPQLNAGENVNNDMSINF